MAGSAPIARPLRFERYLPPRDLVRRALTHGLTELHMQRTTTGMSYGRFAAMIAAGTVVMYILMYLNTFQIDHVFYSQTRMWMAVVMGATMSVIMLLFMWSMYQSTRMNVGIVVGSVVLFAAALWLVRSQQTVDDVSYMKAMIPHHSIAIMTSERAHIRDSRVRELADRIIEAQAREIDEMKQLIADLQRAPTPRGAPDVLARRRDASLQSRRATLWKALFHATIPKHLYATRGVSHEIGSFEQALSVARNNAAILHAVVFSPTLPGRLAEYEGQWLARVSPGSASAIRRRTYSAISNARCLR